MAESELSTVESELSAVEREAHQEYIATLREIWSLSLPFARSNRLVELLNAATHEAWRRGYDAAKEYYCPEASSGH